MPIDYAVRRERMAIKVEALVVSNSIPGLPPASYTNLRSVWYHKGNVEGREEDLFWVRESHEPQLMFQWKKSDIA
jgi:hypothetical protein